MKQPLTVRRPSNSRFAAVAPFPGAAAALGCCLLGFLGFLRQAEGQKPPAASRPCAIVATATLPDFLLAESQPGVSGDTSVKLGGLSDLVILRTSKSDDSTTVRMLTDRGPTTKLSVNGEKRRAFLSRSFTPKIVDVTVTGLNKLQTSPTPTVLPTTVQSVQSLTSAQGSLVSGRPNGLSGDESVTTPDGSSWLPADPNGIDPEGLAIQQDGSWWITEEYRPSIIYCDASGTVRERYVPEGTAPPGAEMAVHDNLPARYAYRKDNRGFEATALSPDQQTLWALLQSPLEFPRKDSAKTTGNVRLLAFDTIARQPKAEYVYRLGDPADPSYQTTGVSLDDGKLCAMAAIDDASLLVLEQSDAGDAKLYRCCWDNATNTLTNEQPIEPIGNLLRHGISCLKKTLVADLGPLLPQLARDITGGQWKPEPTEPVAGLKLEGMAILDSKHVIIGNDNDFNIDQMLDQDEPIRRSCLWVIALNKPL